MVDYREILRLQSLEHNITQIVAQLPQHRKRSRTAFGFLFHPQATWRRGDKFTDLRSTLFGTTAKSESLSKPGLCLDQSWIGVKRCEPGAALESTLGQSLQSWTRPIPIYTVFDIYQVWAKNPNLRCESIMSLEIQWKWPRQKGRYRSKILLLEKQSSYTYL